MSTIISELLKKLNNQKIKFQNERSVEIINNYSFNIFRDNISLEDNKQIYTDFKASNVIIVDYSEILNQICQDQLFIIGFQRTILIINRLLLSSLQLLFIRNPHLVICFLSNSKEHFDQQLQIKYDFSECNAEFIEAIFNFNRNISISESNKKSSDQCPYFF